MPVSSFAIQGGDAIDPSNNSIKSNSKRTEKAIATIFEKTYGRMGYMDETGLTKRIKAMERGSGK
jgi:hypothetical protein